MDIFRISSFIAYDHTQGAFMFYNETTSSMRMIPCQYVSHVESLEKSIQVVCDTKHLKETFEVKTRSPEVDVEKITFLLEQF